MKKIFSVLFVACLLASCMTTEEPLKPVDQTQSATSVGPND